MEDKMFIYLTTNKINNKKYIGYCTRNDDSYLGSGSLLKEAINKYGKENFERIILENCNSIEELSSAEQKWIKYYNAVESKDFYNLSEGGYGGNPETVKRYWESMSKSERRIRNGYIKSLNRSGDNNGMYGKTHSDETKKLIGSKSINRNWHHPDVKGSKNPKAKKVKVTYNNDVKFYDCMKDICNDYDIPYGTIKGIVKNKTNYSEKYKIKVEYVI